MTGVSYASCAIASSGLQKILLVAFGQEDSKDRSHSGGRRTSPI